MWSDTYDRELTDVFAIQDEIAKEILKQLKARLLDEEIELVESQRTDPDVYDLYLLAKQRLYNRSRQTIESAAGLLDQAIAKDPNYAPALAQRGIATLLLTESQYGDIPDADAKVQSKRFLDAALEIDPQLAEAWAGLGLYHRGQPGEHEQAIEALTRALELNPNLIDASHWLQLALGDIGEPSSALQIIEQMMERDPLYRPGFFSGVVVYNNLGYEDKAQALIDRFRSYDPSSPILLGAESMHHSYNGRAARAVPLAERARDLEPANGVTQFWLTIALLETQQLERIVAEGVGFAKVAALDVLGRREEAFEYAGELSREGILTPLFALYNRADRSQELVDYLEERWPGLSRFAEDNPHDEFGYTEMAELALAYSRTGNSEKFDEALLFIEQAMSKLRDQGINNNVFMVENAKYLTLAGNYDEALTELERALERGWRGFAPVAAFVPIFEPISDDPRFIAVETAMVENINIEREALGLEPIDPLNQL
jgi:tetratricopeptide (TPR) repeat protein